MADRIWFITGASSGFGRELAKVALDSPAKAARAILQAIESPRPPLRLPLGGDALEWIQQVRDREEADHREWESVIRGTDFDPRRG
jgi:NAD(P)-dependent dehydrogenase (short-subunit alcohol dehydrogenase family)